MSTTASYDPRVIERFAEQLLGKAESVRVAGAVTGGVLGVIVGSFPLTPLESVWPIPARFGIATILIGALVGVLIGYVLGEGCAFRYRVQAQMALFQLDIERKVESAVRDAARRAAPAPTPTPAEITLAAPPPVAAPQLTPSLLRQPPLSRDPELPPLSPPTAL